MNPSYLSNKLRIALVLAATAALATIGAAVEPALGDKAANPVVYRALLLEGNETYDADMRDLGDALEKPKAGKDDSAWYASVRRVDMQGAEWSQVRKKVQDVFKDADDNDVSLIYIATTGGKVDDGADKDDDKTGDQKIQNCKALPCDEYLVTIKGTDDTDPEFLRDDGLDDLLAPFDVDKKTMFNGPKIVLVDACYGGGLADGTRDLPLAKSVIMLPCGTNELSRGQSPAFDDSNKDGHFWFNGFLIAGLADNGNGKARADANANGEVTVDERFNYMSAKVTAREPRQHPRKNFDKGDKDLVALKYNDKTLIKHSDVALDADGKPQRDKCDGDESRCRPLGQRPAQNVYDFEILDTQAGMASVTVLSQMNASAIVQTFEVGSTSPVLVTATQTAGSESGRIQLEVVSTDGFKTVCLLVLGPTVTPTPTSTAVLVPTAIPAPTGVPVPTGQPVATSGPVATATPIAVPQPTSTPVKTGTPVGVPSPTAVPQATHLSLRVDHLGAHVDGTDHEYVVTP